MQRKNVDEHDEKMINHWYHLPFERSILSLYGINMLSCLFLNHAIKSLLFFPIMKIDFSFLFNFDDFYKLLLACEKNYNYVKHHTPEQKKTDLQIKCMCWNFLDFSSIHSRRNIHFIEAIHAKKYFSLHFEIPTDKMCLNRFYRHFPGSNGKKAF